MQYPSLAAQDPLDVLRLIRTPNVGPITFFQLIRRFGKASRALEALPELSRRGGRQQPLIACPEALALKEMEAAEKFGARFILYGAPDYPKLLHAISDPPPLIAVTGHSHLWQRKDIVAMVGARNASANGCQFAARLAKELGSAGLTVASGLARGIDTFVHKGSLAGGTVAVIAGGIDNIYPSENEPLFKQIRDSGAIISEQPFGAIPFSGAFPGRNRIIAGMSLGTVVVEASPKSGSLITARFAMENNREVFAVPGSPLDPRSKGCNQLIRQGATMVESAADILQGIAHLRNLALGENPPMSYAPDAAALPDDAELGDLRRRILEKLGTTPVAVDELVEQCETSTPSVLAVLLELELAGRLKRSAGNKVYLLEMAEAETPLSV
ncbi:MAG: DNA-processing protein DprA [Pseudomonadota bacterium]|nr:DNA-processing protein DprA [Pseudomonadota bacterium]